ncbi:MAG: DUF4260 domain-containing protein [Gemmatimonadota bacterium]
MIPCRMTHTVRWLRFEGAAVFAAALAGYALLDASWWLFAALFLAPDLSMLGYLGGPRRGAWIYNLFHTYLGPVTLLGWPLAGGPGWAAAVAAIWAAHIGMDRALGYGLKEPDGFRHTHLGRSG